MNKALERKKSSCKKRPPTENQKKIFNITKDSQLPLRDIDPGDVGSTWGGEWGPTVQGVIFPMLGLTCRIIWMNYPEKRGGKSSSKSVLV